MKRSRPHWRLRAAVTGAFLVAGLTVPASAGSGNSVLFVGYWIPGGPLGAHAQLNFIDEYFEEGVAAHDGTLTSFDCVEIVQGRDGSDTLFARTASVDGGEHAYMRIVDIRDGVGTAMGGIASRQTSPDHCGAAAVTEDLRFYAVKVKYFNN